MSVSHGPRSWEHKALKAKSWADVVKRGVELSKPIYYAQLQLYMAYMELEVALFTCLNKDTQELHHERVDFVPHVAQGLSDKAVEIIRAAEANDLPPRIAASLGLLSLPVLSVPLHMLGGAIMTLHVASGAHPAHGFVPSDAQARAIAAIRDWYLNRRHEQQVFRLFGYAGSGKSTITRHAIDALGLETAQGRGWGGVLFAAFTGKAALVLPPQGNAGAAPSTASSTASSQATEEEVEAATAKNRQEAKRQAPPQGLTGFERTSARGGNRGPSCGRRSSSR